MRDIGGQGRLRLETAHQIVHRVRKIRQNHRVENLREGGQIRRMIGSMFGKTGCRVDDGVPPHRGFDDLDRKLGLPFNPPDFMERALAHPLRPSFPSGCPAH